MNPYLSTLEEFGLHHSSDYSKGAKRIDYYVPDHHWKSPVQVVTHLRKGEPFKFEWRGSGMTGGTTVEGLRKYLENDLAKYNSMVERHRAGSGEFAPGRQNPADPGLVQQARKIGYDQGTIDRLRREDMPPPWPRNMMPALRGLVFPQGARSNDMLPPDAVDAYKEGYRAGRKGMRNPGRGWFTRCLDSVSASGSAVDPGAVCGAQLKKMGYRRRNPPKLTPYDAREILSRLHIEGQDFFELSGSKVGELLEVVKRVGYRRSSSAPGSTGRMFHQYLVRLASRKSNPRRRKNLSIRKYKKGRLSGYEEATGRAVKWFRARGKRTRAERKAKRTRTNPTKRYQIRAAGRVFTVSAKTKRAAQAEVAKYCRQHGLKQNPSGLDYSKSRGKGRFYFAIVRPGQVSAFEYSPTLAGARKKAQGISNRLGIEFDIVKHDREPSPRGGYSPAERVASVKPQSSNRRRRRNSYDRTTGQWSSSDRWIVEQQRGGIGFRGHGWKVIRRMGGEVYGTYDYKGDAIRTAEILNEQLDNPRRRRRTRRNSWTDNRKGHSEAAKLGWERRRLASKRKKKRNRRSASMLSPRTGRRTIRSVERRTSQALRRYLGGRR